MKFKTGDLVNIAPSYIETRWINARYNNKVGIVVSVDRWQNTDVYWIFNGKTLPYIGYGLVILAKAR